MKIFYYPKNKDKILNFFAQVSDISNLKEKSIVETICRDVAKNGDKAVLKYSREFDQTSFKKTDEIIVKPIDIIKSLKKVKPDFLAAINKAKNRIEHFHKKQLKNKISWQEKNQGRILGEIYNPIEKAGVYVPGGQAFYPSSLLMNVIPARIAGVKEIIICTPSDNKGEINNHVLATAYILGLKKIFKIGGAQAIAAMAYGTGTIPKVHKIVGPGNIFVALAKSFVRETGLVEIDSIAGPSEILIIADKSANPRFVAADLISQAEHQDNSCCILITDSKNLAGLVRKQIGIQVKGLKRTKQIISSLEKYSAIIITRNIRQAVELSNKKAPEHLEIITKNPWSILPDIKNAGTILTGQYSPVSLGDYIAGPNHVLPTNSAAKFSSPLGVETFLKKSNLISYSLAALRKDADYIKTLAETETLNAHWAAVKMRISGG